jgi:hypothetical protein
VSVHVSLTPTQNGNDGEWLALLKLGVLLAELLEGLLQSVGPWDA